MADEVDSAAELSEIFLRAALSVRKPTLPFIGSCWNCEVALSIGVFCDSDCSEDYQKRQR